jgi:hypothetical protein
MSNAIAPAPDMTVSQERRYRDVEIGCLLFVSGPSSVGKSSFIRQLVGGGLPDSIRARFPEGIEKWQRVEPKTFAGVAASAKTGAAARQFIPGLIFHYDTMRIYNRGWAGYGEDRALDILHAARKVFVVDIRAPRAALERHWLSRISRQNPPRGMRRLLKRFKRWILRRSYIPEPIERVDFSALAAYRDADFLKTAYERWDAFLRAGSADSRKIDILRVESVSREDSEPVFRLDTALVEPSEHMPAR